MTDIEEKKIDEVEEEESDFADEIKTAEPAPAPVEEKEPEETIDLHSEEPEEEEAPAPTSASGKKGKITIEYPDENLGQVELARQEFYKVYHKSNIVKWIVCLWCLHSFNCLRLAHSKRYRSSQRELNVNRPHRLRCRPRWSPRFQLLLEKKRPERDEPLLP